MRPLLLLLAACVPASAAPPSMSNGGGGASGGTLNTQSQWHYSVLPASDNAGSEYFYSSVAALTEWDPGSTDCAAPAVDGDGRGAHVSVVANSGGDWCGAYLAASDAGEGVNFTFTIPIRLGSRYGVANQLGGIMACEDLAAAPTTADCWFLYAAGDAGANVALNWQRWSDYNSWSSTIDAFTFQDVSSLYFLRIYVDDAAETLSALVSTDGRSWIRLGAPTSYTGVSIASVGFAGSTANATDTLDMYAEFLQFEATSDPYAPMGGLVSVD